MSVLTAIAIVEGVIAASDEEYLEAVEFVEENNIEI